MGRSISRRTVLGVAAAGGAAMAAPLAPARAGRAPRIAIIGAGLAGLTAALDLTEAGCDVEVLEARDRAGGRVHTLYAPWSAGLHAEAGGESIDDTHDAIQAMLRRFHLSTERRPLTKEEDARVYYRGRTGIVATFLAQRGGKVLTDYLRFGDALGAFSADVDPVHPERAPHAAAIDARSLEDFLRDLHLVPEAEFLVRLQNRGEFNAELRDVSLLFAAQQANVTASEPLTAVETMRIAGGNSKLPLAMAATLGHRVRLSSPVTAVSSTPTGVRVTAGGSAIDAEWLVIAAPMPPMRKVQFTPSLPPAAAAMVAGLDLGHAMKVTREYRLPFWDALGVSGFTVTDLPFAIGWAPTDSYPSVGGLMTQFITGDTAHWGASLPARQVYPAFEAQLDRVYPEGRGLLTPRHSVMIWAHEPYTGGGYAVFRPGQMTRFWPVLRDGVGRIKFAGEHTEPLAGYMESAVRSGHRVAAEILAAR